MSYTKKYDFEVPVTDEGHLQLGNSFEEQLPNNKKSEDKLIPAKYRSLINLIFFTCVAGGSKPWSSKENMAISLPGLEVFFNIERIEVSKRFIEIMLRRLKSVDCLDDLKYLKNGKQWTELKSDVKRLLCLGLATNLISDEIVFNDTPRLKKS